MRTERTVLKNIAWGVPVVIGAMLFTQCSSDRTDGGADTMDTRNGVGVIPAEETVSQAELDAEVNATYDGTDPNSVENANAVGGGTAVIYTPAKERMLATNDMRGLRGLLVADLEEVRARLNDGARTESAREADKALAADLAQGLERVDRALAALGASSDASWASIREVQLKEVSEVRSWMADYRAKDTWVRK